MPEAASERGSPSKGPRAFSRTPAPRWNELQRRENGNRVRQEVGTSLLFKATVASKEQNPTKSDRLMRMASGNPAPAKRCERRNQHQGQAQTGSGTSEGRCSHHSMRDTPSLQVYCGSHTLQVAGHWNAECRGILVLPEGPLAIGGNRPSRFDPLTPVLSSRRGLEHPGRSSGS
jgi:hypothetical protein